MNICGNCFNNIPSGSVCRICGFDNDANNKRYPIALPTGTILRGQYFIGRVLGQGGFGITYLAQDNQTKERLAIKEYFPTEFVGRAQGTLSVQQHSTLIGDGYENGKQQFLEEARTLAEFIGDDHIVRVYRFFTENDTAYFVMEFVDGEALNDYMKKRSKLLTVEEADSLLIPLMDSLEKVHQKGIVHRDISPDNIIINAEGDAKLIDFGAARYSTGEMSKSLDVILKHGFAPYEQYARRGRRGPFTDVYALAATYYFAITGKVPPDAVDRIVEDQIVPPSELGVKISKAKEKVLLKALAPNYKDRFQTMAEFRQALQPFGTVKKVLNIDSLPEKMMSSNESKGQTNYEKKRELDTAFTDSAASTASSPAVEQIKKNRLGWKIPVAAAILLVIVAGILVGTSVSGINKRIAEGNFSEASTMSLAKSIISISDSTFEAYLNAGVLYESGDYEGAEEAFKTLSESGYKNSEELYYESIYNNSLSLAEQGQYSGALTKMNKLKSLEYKDAADQVNAITFEQAKTMLGTTDRAVEGYTKIQVLANNKYNDAVKYLDTAKGILYDKLVENYNKGSIYIADKYTTCLKGYKDADKYIKLITAQTVSSCTENNYKDVLSVINFADAKKVLVSKETIAIMFLEGKWKTSDGKYYITFTRNSNNKYAWQASYNVPWLDYGDYATIKNGEYLLYEDGNMANSRCQWDITVVAKDEIKVYAHKNGQTYILFRQ